MSSGDANQALIAAAAEMYKGPQDETTQAALNKLPEELRLQVQLKWLDRFRYQPKPNSDISNNNKTL
jgi:hypothetical protein